MQPSECSGTCSRQWVFPDEVCGIGGAQSVLEDPDASEKDDGWRFYTIGYEGRTIGLFVEKLRRRGITRLIDVREKPFSRKKGFSKDELSNRLEAEGIEYIHMSRLGSPSDIRHDYKDGGSEAVFFEKYRQYVRDCRMDDVRELERYVSERPSVIMCFEASYIHCHRRVLADLIAEMSGFKPVHIRRCSHEIRIQSYRPVEPVGEVRSVEPFPLPHHQGRIRRGDELRLLMVLVPVFTW